MEHVESFIKAGTYLRNWSPRTVKTYRQAFASLQAAVRENDAEPSSGVGSDSSQVLTKARLEAWVLWLRQKGVTPGGVNMYARTVNSYLSWKFDEKLCEGKLRLKLLPDPKGPVAVPSAAEMRMLMAYRPQGFRELRSWALAVLLADTGLRIAEALGLERERVDLEGLSLQVLGKGRKWRTVPFSLEARKALWRLCQQCDRKGYARRFAFPTSSGTALSYFNAYRDLKAVCASAGFEGSHVHPHAFRHFLAAGYITNGGDIYRLSRILGHASITTTQLYLRSMGVEAVQEGHSRFSPLARL